jgi:uncharacterized protein (DUF1501 family)
MALTRREFLLHSFGALGAATLAMERFGMTDAFAEAADYKALVCIFLFGGNDSDNIFIPYDTYSQYAAKRNNAANVGIPQTSLLQINPPSLGAKFGLHPALDGIKSLWDLGKVAIIPNVGPLVEPLTRNEFRNRLKRIPLNLFSHSDQETQWQTAVANGFVSSGWGGRTADAVSSLNGSATFPMITTMAGTNIFSTGAFRRPLALSPAPSNLNRVIRLDGFPNPPASLQGIPRYDAMEAIQALDDGFTVINATNQINMSTFATMEALRAAPDPLVPPFPLNPRTGLGNQLEQVAKVISLRDTLGLKRQIFFCSLGGFDTHGDQNDGADATIGQHANLWATIDDAVTAFYNATVGLGVQNSVTLCTMSEFGRTFVPNGGIGTDHAWGQHVFVVGGAVNGGNCYGVPGTGPGQNGTVFPTLVAGGPDDTDSGTGARGRWIPTTAIDQVAATLASWMGVANVDLPGVCPNIGNFGTANLGFMV